MRTTPHAIRIRRQSAVYNHTHTHTDGTPTHRQTPNARAQNLINGIYVEHENLPQTQKLHEHNCVHAFVCVGECAQQNHRLGAFSAIRNSPPYALTRRSVPDGCEGGTSLGAGGGGVQTEKDATHLQTQQN